MAGEKTANKSEIASQKKTVKLPPAIGDWTTYRPSKVLVKKVKSGLYGFDRLSKEDLKYFFKIHYRFIQSLLGHLRYDLKASVELFSCQNEQTTYLSFIRTLSTPVLQGKITLPGIHEGVQLFFDLNIAHSLVNHALGSKDSETLSRGLTETENIVFNTAFSEYLADYSAAFAGVISNPLFETVSSPDVTLDPAINHSMTFVVFTAEIQTNDNPLGKISFGYLGNSLKLLLGKYDQKEKAKPLNLSRLSSVVLGKIAIPIRATIGGTTLMASELNSLEVGDVVSTGTSITSAVIINLGKSLKIATQPGVKNKKKSAKIIGFNDDQSYVPPPVQEATEPEKAVLPEIEIKPENTIEDAVAPEPKIMPQEGQEPVDEELDLEENFEDDDFSDDDLEDISLDDENPKEGL